MNTNHPADAGVVWARCPYGMPEIPLARGEAAGHREVWRAR